MNPGRNVYFIVCCILSVVLVTGALAGWYSSGIGEGWHVSRRSDLFAYAAPMCCIFGAAGLIWLGRRWLKLAAAITSAASSFKMGKYEHIVPAKYRELESLISAAIEDLSNSANSIVKLEKQVRDLQIQMQLAQRQKQNTEAIIYSIRDAVIVIDEFDKLLMANAAAGQLFGFDYKTAAFKSVDELLGENQKDLVEFLRQSRQNKVRHTKREIVFTNGGCANTFNCIVSCVYGRNEQFGGVAAVLHDITREKEVSQMKDSFVSHVSHELKTPLASITAYAEMLVDGEAGDEETRKEFYSVIQEQAKRLNRLIEDILNIARIESGLMKINKEPVSLTILLQEQLKMIKSYAEEKDIKVTGDIPIVYEPVYGDKDMISQVIVNLLSNAVKYTPRGGSVKVDTEVDELAKVVRVKVTDTGVGIPANEIGHLFEKFYRVEANKKQAKGTGLGLNLVKQIVENLHGGKVFVTSQVGVGSTFGFELPVARGEKVEVTAGKISSESKTEAANVR